MTPERVESVKPIRPEEVIKRREQSFPPQAIESFNELIAQNCEKGHSSVLQKDVVALMIKNGLNEKEIYEKKWLNVEEIYKKNGWDVEYRKPDYGDNDFEPYYTFNRSKK
jgi:hypothetical protein